MLKCFPTPVLSCGIGTKFALPWLSASYVAVILLAARCLRRLCLSRPGPRLFPLEWRVVAWSSLIRRPAHSIVHKTIAENSLLRSMEGIGYVDVYYSGSKYWDCKAESRISQLLWRRRADMGKKRTVQFRYGLWPLISIHSDHATNGIDLISSPQFM